MKHRIAIAAMAAAALIAAACADGARVLAPSEAPSYTTIRSAAFVNPKTHQLETVQPEAGSPMTSLVTGNGSAPAVFAANGAPGIARTGGFSWWEGTDSTHHVQKIVALYRSGGGPPAAMQHYIDGKLVATSAYSWVKTSTGWYRSQSVTNVVNNGSAIGSYTLTGTYTQTTAPCHTKNCGPQQTVMLVHPRISPMQKVFGTFALAVANACFPSDAAAQVANFSFYACRHQWLTYASYAIGLAAAGAALSATFPEGVEVTVPVFIGILAKTADAEDALIDCMIANEHVATGTGGQGGAGGGYASPPSECLAGSYAAHCTTAFTM